MGGALPPQVDALSMWEVASILGRNIPEPREPWPENAPSMRTMRKHLALSEGRPTPGDDEPDDAEYAKLLEMAGGGTREQIGSVG